jgi:hypothetical protein
MDKYLEVLNTIGHNARARALYKDYTGRNSLTDWKLRFSTREGIDTFISEMVDLFAEVGISFTPSVSHHVRWERSDSYDEYSFTYTLTSEEDV